MDEPRHVAVLIPVAVPPVVAARHGVVLPDPRPEGPGRGGQESRHVGLVFKNRIAPEMRGTARKPLHDRYFFSLERRRLAAVAVKREHHAFWLPNVFFRHLLRTARPDVVYVDPRHAVPVRHSCEARREIRRRGSHVLAVDRHVVHVQGVWEPDAAVQPLCGRPDNVRTRPHAVRPRRLEIPAAGERRFVVSGLERREDPARRVCDRLAVPAARHHAGETAVDPCQELRRRHRVGHLPVRQREPPHERPAVRIRLESAAKRRLGDFAQFGKRHLPRVKRARSGEHRGLLLDGALELTAVKLVKPGRAIPLGDLAPIRPRHVGKRLDSRAHADRVARRVKRRTPAGRPLYGRVTCYRHCGQKHRRAEYCVSPCFHCHSSRTVMTARISTGTPAVTARLPVTILPP